MRAIYRGVVNVAAQPSWFFNYGWTRMDTDKETATHLCRARPRVGPFRVPGATEQTASRKVRPYNESFAAQLCLDPGPFGSEPKLAGISED